MKLIATWLVFGALFGCASINKNTTRKISSDDSSFSRYFSNKDNDFNGYVFVAQELVIPGPNDKSIGSEIELFLHSDGTFKISLSHFKNLKIVRYSSIQGKHVAYGYGHDEKAFLSKPITGKWVYAQGNMVLEGVGTLSLDDSNIHSVNFEINEGFSDYLPQNFSLVGRIKRGTSYFYP